MSIWRCGFRATALLLVSVFFGALAQADPPPPGVVWLDVDGIDQSPFELPQLFLTALSDDPDRHYLEVLGEAAFQAPEILGTLARRSGLSCQACHVNGTINPNLFIEGPSARRGGLDVTSDLFNAAADDGIANHRDVPSLRGVRATAPYGREGLFPTLRAFTEHVIVDEFGGTAPPARLLDALVAYQNRLEFGTNTKIERNGVLTAEVANKRGESLFNRPFANQPNLSCATCHIPDHAFVDGKQHDVGTGGVFDTPTIRGIDNTGPYLHDGSVETLTSVVSYFDNHFKLQLSKAEQSDLVAYLEASGAVDQAQSAVTLSGELEAIDRFRWALGEAVKQRRFDDATLLIDVSRRRIGELHDRYTRDHQLQARQSMIVWSRALQGVGRAVDADDATAARFAFLAYTSAFWEMTQTVISSMAGARIKAR